MNVSVWAIVIKRRRFTQRIAQSIETGQAGYYVKEHWIGSHAENDLKWENLIKTQEWWAFFNGDILRTSAW